MNDQWKEAVMHLMKALQAVLQTQQFLTVNNGEPSVVGESVLTNYDPPKRFKLTTGPVPTSMGNEKNNKVSAKAEKLSRPYWQTPQEILQEGMTIRFYKPEAIVRSKLRQPMILNRVKGSNIQLIDTRVEEYVKEGILVEIPRDKALFIASIAVVPRASDPSRPREVLDFTELNQFILDSDCKLPTRKNLVGLADQYSYAASIDVKSCYTNIKLNESFQAYCCVGWKGKVYKFTRVPFGIKCAPACCQVVTSHLAHKTTLVYLDDFLLLGESEERVLALVEEQKVALEKNGFPISLTKSMLKPRQEIEFCGYRICFGSEQRGVYTTDKHLMDLSLLIRLCQTSEHIDLKTWQRFLGKYNWCRAKKEDEAVHDKLVALMNERDSETNHIMLDHVARAMLSNMVARCSLSFDF